jgi:hypothetical protein
VVPINPSPAAQEASGLPPATATARAFSAAATWAARAAGLGWSKTRVGGRSRPKREARTVLHRADGGREGTGRGEGLGKTRAQKAVWLCCKVLAAIDSGWEPQDQCEEGKRPAAEHKHAGACPTAAALLMQAVPGKPPFT